MSNRFELTDEILKSFQASQNTSALEAEKVAVALIALDKASQAMDDFGMVKEAEVLTKLIERLSKKVG